MHPERSQRPVASKTCYRPSPTERILSFSGLLGTLPSGETGDCRQRPQDLEAALDVRQWHRDLPVEPGSDSTRIPFSLRQRPRVCKRRTSQKRCTSFQIICEKDGSESESAGKTPVTSLPGLVRASQAGQGRSWARRVTLRLEANMTPYTPYNILRFHAGKQQRGS